MNDHLEILLSGQQFKKLYEKKFHQLAEKYDLTKLEIEILLFLENNKQYDTAKDIVDLKFFAKSHVSHAIASLINNEYIVGIADESDRRCVHLKVSENARRVIVEAKEIRKELVDILYKDISIEEKQVMENIAKKIASNIKEALETGETF